MTQQKTAWFVQYKDKEKSSFLKELFVTEIPLQQQVNSLFQSLHDAKLMSKLISLYEDVK